MEVVVVASRGGRGAGGAVERPSKHSRRQVHNGDTMPRGGSSWPPGTTEITCRVSLEAAGTGLGDCDGRETVVHLKSRRAAAALWLSVSSSASRCALRIERVQDSCLEWTAVQKPVVHLNSCRAVAALRPSDSSSASRCSAFACRGFASSTLRSSSFACEGAHRLCAGFWSSETYRMCVAVAGEGCCEWLLAAD